MINRPLPTEEIEMPEVEQLFAVNCRKLSKSEIKSVVKNRLAVQISSLNKWITLILQEQAFKQDVHEN